MAELERNATGAAPAVKHHADLENLPALFGRLGDDVVKLLDTKISLLRVELREEIAAYVRGLVLLAFGAGVALIGVVLLSTALAFFISSLFTGIEPPNHYALGFLLTGALLAIIGGGITWAMKKRLAAQSVVPSQSLEELRKDKQWLKKEIQS